MYDSSGYVNVRGILDEGYPFNFLVGGRGTGKTYTTLKVAKEDGRRFMLMRRTQSQADLISKPEFSVFKPLNEDLGWNVMVKSISKYNSMFYEPEGDAEENPHPIGYTCALSTLSNMRGFDASDIQLLIYDEFIPEKHERLLKNEADALFNAYETMNRNRELKGIAPIQMVCLANANDITNPMVAAFQTLMELSAAKASLVQFAFYGGYATMAVPAALFIRRFSYKKGVMLGLALYATGAFLFIPAAANQSFLFFCISSKNVWLHQKVSPRVSEPSAGV